MRLLLTGGTGFFGKALLRHWIKSKFYELPVPEVTVLSRSPKSFLARYPEFSNHSWLRFHEGDILNMNTFPIRCNFTHVVHAATDSTFGPALKPFERYRQIVDGTRNLLDFALTSGAGRFLLTSSGGVYGSQTNRFGSFTEESSLIVDPPNANNTYSLAKLAAEHICSLYYSEYGLQTVIARCFSFVGRDLPLDVHFAIGNFIRDSLWNKEIIVKGNGTAMRSYMDQRDLAEWLLVLLEKGVGGRVYNVGSDEAISISELAHLVRDIISPHKPVIVLGNTVHGGGGGRYVPDISRAQAELDLRVKIALADAIKCGAKPYL